MARPKKIKKPEQLEFNLSAQNCKPANNIELFVRQKIQEINQEEEKQVKKRRGRKKKKAEIQENELKIKSTDFTTENAPMLNKPQEDTKANACKSVMNKIKEIDWDDLAKEFEKAVNCTGTRKRTIRVEKDVDKFYESWPCNWSAAANQALRLVMQAVEARGLKQ